MAGTVPEYGFNAPDAAHTAAYLRVPVMSLLPKSITGKSVLDIGCGNGYWAGQLLNMGCEVTGIDASEQGIAIARRLYPKGRFERWLVDDELPGRLAPAKFDIIISTEVVEHLYDPRSWARAAFNLLKPGGRFICSTPYHGYAKNLAISVFNKWDWHLKPLWDGGHIKFFSRATLEQLLAEAGFTNMQFRGAGRLPYLWMSMVMSGDRPS